MSKSLKYQSLYGSDSAPYYIFTPRWTEHSAGIRALHYLCHALNAAGQKAYIAIDEPPGRSGSRFNSRLMTPPLTREIAKAHKNHGFSPIVIYSESTIGNPLGVDWCVRYILNYPGALGGPSLFKKGDLLCAFSNDILAKTLETHPNSNMMSLFLPPVDPNEIVTSEKKGDYQIVYAGKYRDFIGEPPVLNNDRKTIEIFRSGPKKQGRAEVLSLLAGAEIVYSFENSSIVTEAVLSGTPGIFVPNQFLEAVIGSEELGGFGTGFLGDEHSIKNAKSTVRIGRERYLHLIDDFSKKLDVFIEWTQTYNSLQPKGNKVTLGLALNNWFLHKVQLAMTIYKKQGFFALSNASFQFFQRQLWRRKPNPESRP